MFTMVLSSMCGNWSRIYLQVAFGGGKVVSFCFLRAQRPVLLSDICLVRIVLWIDIQLPELGENLI